MSKFDVGSAPPVVLEVLYRYVSDLINVNVPLISRGVQKAGCPPKWIH